MPIDPSILKLNAEQTNRLERFVFSSPDYNVDLCDGWTAAVAFAHMGFWDRRQAELLRNWNISDPLPESATDDQLNPVLERYWQQLTPEATGQMAVEAAHEVDEIISSLSDDKVEALLSMGKEFMLARGNHRKEHIDQIEREL
jgi:hypothetical protein